MSKYTVPVNADKIRKYRKRLGWSQAELADRADLGVRTITSLEKDGAEALPATVQLVADAFGVPRKDLVLLPEPPPPPKAAGSAYHTVTLESHVPPEEIDATSDIPEALSVLAKELSYILVISTPYGLSLEIEVAERDLPALLVSFARGKLAPLSVRTIRIQRDFAVSPEVEQQIAPLFEDHSYRLGPSISIAGRSGGIVEVPPLLVAVRCADESIALVRLEDLIADD